jgi:hypothetical protein
MVSRSLRGMLVTGVLAAGACGAPEPPAGFGVNLTIELGASVRARTALVHLDVGLDEGYEHDFELREFDGGELRVRYVPAISAGMLRFFAEARDQDGAPLGADEEDAELEPGRAVSVLLRPHPLAPPDDLAGLDLTGVDLTGFGEDLARPDLAGQDLGKQDLGGQDLAASDLATTDMATAFKYVFVTSVAYDGNLGGLAGADAKCNFWAANAMPALPGTYKAWLSDGTDAPSTRFSMANVPYVRTDLATVATSWSTFASATHQAALTKNEGMGTPAASTITGCGTVPTTLFWSAVLDDGTGNGTGCRGFTSNANGVGAQLGDYAQSSSWSSRVGCSPATNPCGAKAPLLCVQQ